MANLITEKQKRSVKLEYIVRLCTVSLFVPTTLLGFFLLAYIVPYYVSVSNKDLKVAEQFKAVIEAENKENVGDSVSQIILQVGDQMKALEYYNKDNFIPSVYLNRIIESKNKNIRLTKLSFNLNSKNERQFLVSGIASNRDGLVSFIEDLKTKAGFANVDSPVSSFANDVDIPFSLNIH